MQTVFVLAQCSSRYTLACIFTEKPLTEKLFDVLWSFNHLECLEVVDKDIGEPEMVDQLQVDGDHGVHAVTGGHVGQVLGEAGLKVQH